MDDNRYDTISYEENWQSVSTPEYYTYDPEADIHMPDEDEEYGQTEDIYVKPAKKQKSSNPWLIIVQLVLCVVIFAAVYVMKEMDLDIFHTIKQWYNAEVNNSLIITENFNGFHFNGNGSGTASPDEA